MAQNQFTSEWFENYKRKQSEKLRGVPDNAAGLHPVPAKRPQGRSLVSALPGEVESGFRPPRRAKILFRVFACRPADWDGYHIKELQDLLVHAGILDGDKWDLLEGQIISEKVRSEAEERTEIEIIYPQCLASKVTTW